MTDHELFMTSSESLLTALKNDRPLEFCWRVLHHVTQVYQSMTNTSFLFMPHYRRDAMLEFVEALQNDITERDDKLARRTDNG